MATLEDDAVRAVPALRPGRLLRKTSLLRGAACRQLHNSRFFGRHRPELPRIDRYRPALPRISRHARRWTCRSFTEARPPWGLAPPMGRTRTSYPESTAVPLRPDPLGPTSPLAPTHSLQLPLALRPRLANVYQEAVRAIASNRVPRSRSSQQLGAQGRSPHTPPPYSLSLDTHPSHLNPARRICAFYLGRVARGGACFGPRVASRALLRTTKLP